MRPATEKLIDLLTGHANSAVVFLFRRAIYLFLLVNTLVLLPVAGEIWGPDAYLLSMDFSGSFYAFLNLLSFTAFEHCHLWFVAGQLLFIVLGLLGLWPRMAAIAVWFFTENLFNRSIDITNGGHDIISLLLFFSIFMAERPKSDGPAGKLTVIRDIMSNLALFAGRLQIVIMYAVAGLCKLQGALWERGEALYYVLNVEEYSHPMAVSVIASSGLLLIAGNYFALGYQLLFPVLIWIKKIRLPVIVAGTVFHLFIAFATGIMDFGFAMIACYFIYYPEAKSQALSHRLSGWKRSLLPGLPFR